MRKTYSEAFQERMDSPDFWALPEEERHREIDYLDLMYYLLQQKQGTPEFEALSLREQDRVLEKAARGYLPVSPDAYRVHH